MGGENRYVQSHTYMKRKIQGMIRGLPWLKKTSCVEGKEKQTEGPWRKRAQLGEKF